MSGETELELQRAVGRLEGKMDALITEVQAANKTNIGVSAALSKRISKLETWQTRIVAMHVLLGAIGGFVLKHLTTTK